MTSLDFPYFQGLAVGEKPLAGRIPLAGKIPLAGGATPLAAAAAEKIRLGAVGEIPQVAAVDEGLPLGSPGHSPAGMPAPWSWCVLAEAARCLH